MVPGGSVQASIPVRYRGPVLTRRGLLSAGVLAGLSAASGCVRRDPTVGDRSVAPTAPTFPPPVDLARHAAAQAGLAALVGSGAGGAERLGAFRARAAQDLAHQAETLSPGTNPAAATGDLSSGCREAAEQHLSADASGLQAARLASAAAYAAAVGALAEAGTPRVQGGKVSAPTVPSPGDAQAMSSLVTELYPAVHALEAVLPRLDPADRPWAATTLQQHLAARQQLLGELARRSLRAPAPEPAYALGSLADAGAALALVTRAQQAVLPAACRLVRTTGASEIRRLGGEVLQQATVALALAGGDLATWPGWA